MALQGDSRAYSLADIFQFISANKYSGTLELERKLGDKGGETGPTQNKRTRESLYFCSGEIWIPVKDVKLDDPYVLVRAGLVDREDLDHGLHFEKKTSTPVLGLLIYTSLIELAKARKVISPYLEEDLYKIFLEETQYTFHKDEFPEDFSPSQREKFFIFPANSIVMEASRREDELAVLEENIGRGIYLCDSENQDLTYEEKRLGAYLNGGMNLKEILFHHSLNRFTLYTTVDKLLKKKVARTLTEEEYPGHLQVLLQSQSYPEAFSLYLHSLKASNKDLSVEMANQLFGSAQLKTNPEFQGVFFHQKIIFSLTGRELLGLLSQALKHHFPLSFSLSAPSREGWLAYVNIKDKSFVFGEKNVALFDKFIRLLVSRGSLPSRDGQALLGKKVDQVAEELVQQKLVPKKQILSFLEDRLVDLLAGLLFEETIFLSLFPPKSKIEPMEKAQGRYGFGSNISSLERKITQIRQKVYALPLGKEVLVLSEQAQKHPSPDKKIRDFLMAFEGDFRPFSRLLLTMMNTFDGGEFFDLALENIEKGNLQMFNLEETRKYLEKFFHERSWESMKILLDSAEVMGYVDEDEFCQKTREDFEYISRFLDPLAPNITGELANFNLAEILQTLVNGQLTGTLTIESQDIQKEGAQTKDLYFLEGEVYILRQERASHREMTSLLIETGAFAAIDETFDDLMSTGLVSEAEISEELADLVKEEIYEIFLWESANFSFRRRGLPKDFLYPPATATKLLLKTDEFLMEAISRLDLWQDILKLIHSEKAIFRFLSPESKQQALGSGLNPQVLYLIDGSHSLEDIIRISGQKKFEVGKIFFELYEYGYIAPLSH